MKLEKLSFKLKHTNIIYNQLVSMFQVIPRILKEPDKDIILPMTIEPHVIRSAAEVYSVSNKIYRYAGYLSIYNKSAVIYNNNEIVKGENIILYNRQFLLVGKVTQVKKINDGYDIEFIHIDSVSLNEIGEYLVNI